MFLGVIRPAKMVRCCLIGSWVEFVNNEVRDAMKKVAKPFVHIRYVVSAQPLGDPHIFFGS